MSAVAGSMQSVGIAAGARPSPFVDVTRQGSGWQQLGVGVLGFVLAILMVVGQISVATTAGISRNLKINVEQLAAANTTMESIIERAGPSVAMERTVSVQAKSLAVTNETMVGLNAAMSEVGKTSEQMESAVEGMQATSSELSTGVAAMNDETAGINDLLGPLPDKARSTHGQLSQIDQDSAALNTELSAISSKMAGYGLPPAKNVKAGKR